MRFKHPVPDDFAEMRAKLGPVRAIARHYKVGMNAVRRWLDETNSPSLRELDGWKLKRPHCSICTKPLQYHNRTGLCQSHYNEQRKVIADERARSAKKKYFLADIIIHTADAFGISRELLTGRSRRRAHVRARQVCFYLGSHMTALSFTEIGKRMNRDHSTVSHGYYAIARLMRDDRELRAVVGEAIRRVKGLSADSPAEPIRLSCMGHKRRPVVLPNIYAKPEPVEFRAPWWELSDDEMIARNIADYRAAGGSFVETHA